MTALYHITDKPKENFHTIEGKKAKGDFMLCLPAQDDNLGENTLSGKGILISIGIENPYISTAEI